MRFWGYMGYTVLNQHTTETATHVTGLVWRFPLETRNANASKLKLTCLKFGKSGSLNRDSPEIPTRR